MHRRGRRCHHWQRRDRRTRPVLLRHDKASVGNVCETAASAPAHDRVREMPQRTILRHNLQGQSRLDMLDKNVRRLLRRAREDPRRPANDKQRRIPHGRVPPRKDSQLRPQDRRRLHSHACYTKSMRRFAPLRGHASRRLQSQQQVPVHTPWLPFRRNDTQRRLPQAEDGRRQRRHVGASSALSPGRRPRIVPHGKLACRGLRNRRHRLPNILLGRARHNTRRIRQHNVPQHFRKRQEAHQAARNGGQHA